MKTSVVDIHKIKGKRPEFDIYAGRAVRNTEFDTDSKWHNPRLTLPEYKEYILEKIKENPYFYNLNELKGKKIGCWCITTDKIYPIVCHVQILMEIIMQYIILEDGTLVSENEYNKARSGWYSFR